MRDGANNRKAPRITYPCSLTIWEYGGYNNIIGNTVNIGSGGLLVNMDQAIMIGAKVDVKIGFEEHKFFECSGRILRCRKYSQSLDYEKDFFSVAIVFDNLNESQQQTLKGMVETLLKQQNSF
jgi:hypothetical protein